MRPPALLVSYRLFEEGEGGRRTHLDGLENVGFDVDGKVLARRGWIGVNVDFLDLARCIP